MAIDTTSLTQEPRKRQTALKMRISEILAGNVIQNNNLYFVEINGQRIMRVNILANVIDKFIGEGEKRYAALTLDDASGQIRIKAFAEETEKIKPIEIGNTTLIVGNVRYFNNEIYILPEIIKIVDARWLAVRKSEFEKLQKKENSAEAIKTKIEKISLAEHSEEREQEQDGSKLRKQIIEMLKQNEEGIDIDKLIMELHAPVEEINNVTTKMLEDAEIYEPKPGRIRLL